jgi:hypothetical protein
MATAYKFGWIPNEEGRYNYPNVFAVEKTSGPERLVIAPSENHLSMIMDLLQVMSDPFGILYVLTVPRGRSEAGRYQTPNPVSRKQTEEFLRKFGSFFENDGRHHVWVASMSNADQLVYDRHNVIYAYGRLEEFQRIALGRGLSKVETVRFPSPHTHNYHAELDFDERNVLQYWDWKRSALRESDE